MPLWKDTDDAANSCIFTPMQFDLPANSANRGALFGNTTADAFVTGETIGTFGVDTAEMITARATAAARPAHAGHVIKREGSGGRSGRVTYEVLVAMGSMSGDAGDIAFPDYALSVLTQPSDSSKSSSNNEVATFMVVAGSQPSGATLSYFWQKWGGSAFANLTAAGAYSNVTTATLSVLANTAANGEIYRVGVASANGGAATVYSSNATFTKLA